MRRHNILTISLALAIIGVATLFVPNYSYAIAQTGIVRYSEGRALPKVINATETIEYTSKQEKNTEIANGVPLYTSISSLTNSCGAVGGAIVVGFYDKYYEELIPNYSSSLSSGTYKRQDSIYIPQLINNLYKLMRTNVDDVGVSQSDCLEGLKTYILNCGRTVNYSNLCNANKIDEVAYSNAINYNQPILLFCCKMNLYTITSTSSSDKVECTQYANEHIAVAYGLYVVKYYNGSTLIKTDKYFVVSTGLKEKSTGLIKVSDTDWCNAAYAISVN